jgi:hypothetical protein
MAVTINRFFNPAQQRWEFETMPEIVPSSPQTLTTASSHLVALHFANSAGSSVTLSVFDGMA